MYMPIFILKSANAAYLLKRTNLQETLQHLNPVVQVYMRTLVLLQLIDDQTVELLVVLRLYSRHRFNDSAR